MIARAAFMIVTWLLAGAPLYGAEAPPQTLPKIAAPFRAPDFALKGEDGKTYRLADFRGAVVIVNFWATWCPPCRYEMPSLERAWFKLKSQKVVILAINVGENADVIFEFTGQYPVTFPLPMDLDGSVVKAYPVTGLPTTYIIDPDGFATHRVVGSREWDDPKLMDELLGMRR